MTIMNHYHEAPDVQLGDVFVWMGTHVTITHVNQRHTFAYVLIRQDNTGACWTKRQRLPLPSNVRPCRQPADSTCTCARAAELEDWPEPPDPVERGVQDG